MEAKSGAGPEPLPEQGTAGVKLQSDRLSDIQRGAPARAIADSIHPTLGGEPRTDLAARTIY